MYHMAMSYQVIDICIDIKYTKSFSTSMIYVNVECLWILSYAGRQSEMKLVMVNGDNPRGLD